MAGSEARESVASGRFALGFDPSPPLHGRIRTRARAARLAVVVVLGLLPAVGTAVARAESSPAVHDVAIPSLDEAMRIVNGELAGPTGLPAEMPAGGVNPAALRELPSPAGRVNDFAGVLDGRTKSAMESLIAEVEDRTSAELAVVTVDSAGLEGVDAYAMRLFNTWGIGKAAKDNGVLLLVAVGDRDVRIEVGIGLESVIPDATAGEILDEDVVPRFRDGDMAGGLAAGLAAIAELVAPGSVAAAHFPIRPSSGCGASSWLPWTLGGIAALVAGFAAWRIWRRRRVRICPACSRPMVRLSEQEEDEFLSELQKTEESVGSAEWDVWRCPDCGHNFALRYDKWFDLYGKCPQCGGETLRSKRIVLSSATYISTGSGVRTQDCANCSFHNEESYVIPVRVRSTTRSGGGFRSSGGGGFGGGRSGGGGASRHW
jgi:uncharacterized protein